MSTTAISSEVELRPLESGPVDLNGSASWVDAHAPHTLIISEPGDVDAPARCYESAREADLVSAAKSGDQHAFAELHRRYRPLLVRKIRRIVGNLEDADDVLQDTMLSAFRHLACFRAESSFRTWITSIATNNSLMVLRKRRGHSEIGLTHVTAEGDAFEIPEISDPLPNPEELYARLQASLRVAKAVKRLPHSFRQVVDRFYHDDLRIVDAANSIGITVSAAKSRLLRARNALRRELKNEATRIPHR